MPDAQFLSLPAVLRLRAVQTPERAAYLFLSDGEVEQERLTYAALDARARAIAAALSRACQPGDRALLLDPPGLDFVAAFFGCLYAGVVAVPAYPPRSPRAIPRLLAILADARPAAVLAAGAPLQRVRNWLQRTPGASPASWLATDGLDPAPDAWEPLTSDGDAVAFLQYTSGSTSAPKGVMVTQANLVHNQRVIQDACGHSEESVFISWLPLYHDLGLIGNLLQATWVGAPCVLMAPVAFLQKPVRWLQAISRYRGTTSGGPNFAYELCARRVTPAEIAKLDLSSWQVAFNGAEPVREETLARFAEAFAPAGFRSGALYPCYGLAEATLMVTGGRPGEETGVREVNGRRLVGCGHALLDLEVAIVDPDTGVPCPPGGVGEIWVAGGSVARGYWNQPEETAEVFGAALVDGRRPWLRTGDLGALLEGELFVAGRLKDLIILHGRNHYPQDLEATAGKAYPSLGDGMGAAFAVDADGEEQLVIVQEADRHAGRLDETAAAIRQAIAEEYEALVYEVVLVAPGGVPRTTSGKVQRRACRDLYLRGELRVLGASRLSATVDEDPLTEALPGSLDRQEVLAGIWAEVLGLERVGIHENFFDLGGHSLLATRVLSRLRSVLGVELPVRSLFERPSVAELGAEVEASRLSSTGLAAPPLTVEPRPENLPLSFAQERLWFLAQLGTGSPAYHLATAIELQGDLREDALAAALSELVARHEALRTTFARVGGAQAQVIHPFAGQSLPVIDLGALPAPRREDEVRRLTAEEARRPFHLERGPLLRAHLLRTAAREHILTLTLHHIISDGWSMEVLVREVTAAYAALARGERPALPELPVQYADYAIWQRSWLAGETLERQLGYWRQCLEGVPVVLELPTDHPRPPVQTSRGAQRSIRLAPQLSLALAALSRRQGATLFMTLVASTAVLLSRWAGQPDIVLGTPIANRTWAELENLIGLIANTLALRIRVSGETGFSSFLAEVRQTALAAYAHQDLPFERLVDDLQIARSSDRTPLFQVMVLLWRTPLSGLDLPGVRARQIELDSGTAKFDVTLRFEDGGGDIGVQAEYATDLFEAATIQRLLAHLQVLLAGAVAAPECRLSELPLLSLGERQQLLFEWNDTARPVASACLHDLFEQQAARSPEALAVEAGGECLTWRQLSVRSDRLARDLRHQGVALETRVGLCLPRSVDQIVAILGVLKAGGAFVPLDPAFPRERLAAILTEAGATVVVTAESLRDRLPAGCTALVAGPELENRPDLPDPLPPPHVGPTNLAYILYTSGSTGRPKGVMIEHRSVVNLAAALGEAVYRETGTSLRVAANAPLVFDASVKQWIQLLSGHSLHIVPDEVRPDPDRMLQFLRERGIQILDCTPSQLSYLLAAGLLHQPGSLERVLVGGEALSRPDWCLLSRSERPVFYNVYGPTECTVDATSAEVRPPESKPVLGRPVANARIYLLDSALHPVIPGASGELCIGGAGMARGYLDRPAQTAERFVPDPWSSVSGERIYRTGDLARQSADGTLEFLGRRDHQVKLHGFRIELGEIEAVLGEHPDVRSAAVLMRADGLGEPRLAAYVACPDEPSPSASDLRSHLKRKLPDYMIPAAFVILPELPRTRNGKIDRTELIALGLPARERESERAPSTPLEKALSGMMAEVLGLEWVGLHDNFFELGGHSLLAVELVASLRDAFGIELPLFHVFDTPTVAGLAAVLLESSEWRQTVEELAPAFLQLTGQGELPGGSVQEEES